MYAGANRALAINLAILAVVAAVSLGVARLIGYYRIVRPVHSLAGVAERVGSGDLTARSSAGPGARELVLLGKSFDHMAAAIQSQRDQLEDANRRLSTILGTAGEGICGLDRLGRFTFVNSAAAQILGFESDELLGKPMHETVHHSRPDGGRFPSSECPMAFTLRQGATRQSEDDSFWSKLGRSVPVSWTCTPIAGSGRRLGAVVVFKDETDRRRIESDLKRLATIDSLTELPNKQAFSLLLEQSLDLSMAAATRGALILVDMDNFRYVNDAFGFSAGDRLIRAVAEVISSHAPRGGSAARTGGDEFAIIAPHYSPVDAIRLAERVLSSIAGVEVPVRDERVRLTASAGLTMFPVEGRKAEDLAVQAEIALYRAKNAGRNRATLYDPDAGEREERTATQPIRTELFAALDEGRFLLNVQPIVRVADSSIDSYEVLVRLLGRDGSIQLPSTFIPQAEEVDLIASVDRKVIDLAFGHWRQSSDSGKPLRVSINVSARTIGPDLSDFVIRSAHRHHADFQKITFEVTETAIQHAGPVVSEFARRIRGAGFKLALDDYGSGSTSFQEICSGRFDHIKLDGSLVKRLATDRTDQVFVRSIVSVAKAQGLVVTAEHVGDETTMNFLREVGVDFAQGFYLGKPFEWKPGQDP